MRAAGVSVSPICQRALAQAVAKVRARQAFENDDRIVAAGARVAAEVAHDEEVDYELGAGYGREWAISRAMRRELRKIADTYNHRDFGRWTWDAQPFANNEDWPTLGTWLQDMDDEPGDWDAFYNGLVEGAADTYHAIQAQAEV